MKYQHDHASECLNLLHITANYFNDQKNAQLIVEADLLLERLALTSWEKKILQLVH